jgi:hypothetical protein
VSPTAQWSTPLAQARAGGQQIAGQIMADDARAPSRIARERRAALARAGIP